MGQKGHYRIEHVCQRQRQQHRDRHPLEHRQEEEQQAQRTDHRQRPEEVDPTTHLLGERRFRGFEIGLGAGFDALHHRQRGESRVAARWGATLLYAFTGFSGSTDEGLLLGATHR